MGQDLPVIPKTDFESEADGLIDKYLADRGVQKDFLELEEKKLIIKELALASKRSEIIPKINALRVPKNLPLLERGFDIQYYAKQYADIIEDISLHYAKHLASKYRFAGRITRVAKLNEIAEAVLDRIKGREGEEVVFDDKVERLHNENIKLFSALLGAIDEQMGKLKLTKMDVNVRSSDDAKPQLNSPSEIKRLVSDAIKSYSSQLPEKLEANFTEVTDYEKCGFAEEWSSSTHCKYHNETCKVQTGELTLCPLFVNKILLSNRDYLARRYVKDNLSVKQIAEIAGCKQVDDKVIEYVRGRIRDLGIARDKGSTGQ